MADHECRTARTISTFVFLDFESTGLLIDRPRITELCLLAVHRVDLLAGSGGATFPRTVNKLTLCLNPQKLIGLTASQITGLYNDSLELQEPFSRETVTLINSFLKRLQSPICLVAHNGNRFDFPLLVKELKRINESLDDELLCADSLEAFRVMDGLEPKMTPPSTISSSTTRIPSPTVSSSTGMSRDNTANLNSSSNHRVVTASATNQISVRLPSNQIQTNHTRRTVTQLDNPDYQTPDKPIPEYLPPLKRKHIGGSDHSHKILKTDFPITGVSVFPSTSGEKVRKRLSFETPKKSDMESATEAIKSTDGDEEELLPLESFFSGSLEDSELIMAADMVEACVDSPQTKADIQHMTGPKLTTLAKSAGTLQISQQLDVVGNNDTGVEKTTNKSELRERKGHEQNEVTSSVVSCDEDQTLSYHLHLPESVEQTGMFTPQSETESELKDKDILGMSLSFNSYSVSGPDGTGSVNNKPDAESITQVNVTDREGVTQSDVSDRATQLDNSNTETQSDTSNTETQSRTSESTTEYDASNSETQPYVPTSNSAIGKPQIGCYIMTGSGYSVVGADTTDEGNIASVKSVAMSSELANQLMISRQNNTTPQKQMVSSTTYSHSTTKTPTPNNDTPHKALPPFTTCTPNTPVLNNGRVPIQTTPNSTSTSSVIKSVTPTPKKKSYKLGEIYLRLYGCLPAEAHKAEDDCVTMVKCVQRTNGFIEWVDSNAVLFSTIEPGY